MIRNWTRFREQGATEIVPDSLEAALMLVSHLLLLLNVPISRIVHKVANIRGHRYSMLRNIFRKEDAAVLDESHAFREQLQTLTLPEGAAAVGRSLAELRLPDSGNSDHRNPPTRNRRAAADRRHGAEARGCSGSLRHAGITGAGRDPFAQRLS